MAIIIDGKVYRNLQEQVQKNKDDIELKQDKLIAGDNITINGNTISSKGGSGTPEDYDTVKAQVEANRVAINTEEESRKAAYTKVESDIELKQDKLIAGDNITINENTISATGGGTPEDYDTVKAQILKNRVAISSLSSDISDLTEKTSTIEDMVQIDDQTTAPSEINQYIAQVKTGVYYRVSAKSMNMTVKLTWNSTSSTSYSNIMKLEVLYDTQSTGYMVLMLKGQNTTSTTFELLPLAAVNLQDVEITAIGTQAQYTLGYNPSYWL